MRRLALLIFALSLFAVPATASAATAGGLKQLGGSAGCIVDESPAPAGCVDVRGMTNIGKIAISPSGSNVYVPSRGRGAIAVFTRAANGSLTQKTGALGCYTSDSTVASQDNCTLVGAGLAEVAAVAVSPDGQRVYAGGNNGGAPVVFSRGSGGDLTYIGQGPGLGGSIISIAVSPDNQSVYTSHTVPPPGSANPGGLVGVYKFSSTGSGITFRQCWSSPATAYGCAFTATNGMVDDPGDLVVTPDNKQLILANGERVSPSFSSGSVVGFTRTTTGANQGDLTGPTSTSCVSGSMTNCQTRTQVFYGRGLALANGGKEIWFAGYYGVFRINRNPATNAFTPVAASSSCLSNEGNGFSCRSTGTSSSRVFVNRDIAVPPDGQNVYFGSENGTASTLYSASRGGDGSISALADPFRCLSLDGGDPCSTAIRGGTPIESIISSPTGRNIYVAGDARLLSFTRDRAPICQNVSANTANNTSVSIALSCSDPDGDPVTYQKVTDPAKGSVGSIQGNRISYGPQLGTSGPDSFQYRARTTGALSDPATVTVNVAAPTGGGGGGGGGTPTTVVPSTTSINSLAFPKFTKLLALKAKNLQAGTTVLVTCKTKQKKKQRKGCPYKKKRFTTTGARAKLDLRKPFKKKKIPVGTKITITITAPGFLGKRITYTTRKGKLPKSKVQCLSASGRAGNCA
jgi:hypothetical protein